MTNFVTSSFDVLEAAARVK